MAPCYGSILHIASILPDGRKDCIPSGKTWNMAGKTWNMHNNPTLGAFALVFAIGSVGMGACGGKTSSTLPTAPTAATPPPQAAVPPAVTGITITGATTLSGRGETERLSAFVTYADGTMMDRTSTTRWTSGNENVVTINSEGLVTAIGDGQTTITAEFGTMTAAKTIRVDLP